MLDERLASETFFLLNYSLDAEESEFEAVDVRLLPPACAPEQVQGGICFEILGTKGLAPAAIWRGSFIKLDILKLMARLYKVPLPRVGSGSRGALVKIDYVTTLVEYFFANASEKEKEEMIKGIMGSTKTIDPDILHILSHLDPENQEDQAFIKLKKYAKEELEKQLVEKGRRSVKEKRAREQPEARPAEGGDGGDPAGEGPQIPAEEPEPPQASGVEDERVRILKEKAAQLSIAWYPLIAPY